MKKLINWIPALVVMTVIFILSSQPGEVVNSTFARTENVQKLGHLILFSILCLSYFKATKSIKISILLTLFYAIFDEFRQSFTPGRSSSISDIFVDMIGASISGIILWKILPNLPEKLKNLLLK
ncbi:VanZ family protein [Patescibacteria group bacterium]|nr:VanZ family protein [Patescibacteria group bacterium]